MRSKRRSTRCNGAQDADALQMVFVAGNESAEQDPRLTIQRATAAASRRGVVVNAIYCGADSNADARGWQRVATSTNGRYASIDQNAAAVANVATPFDDGAHGTERRAQRHVHRVRRRRRARPREPAEQDSNAAAMSPAAAASRTVSKAGALYRADWDLVGAVESGKELAAIPAAELPAELQALPPAEREAFVREKAERRQAYSSRVGELAAARSEYIAEQTRESAARRRDSTPRSCEGLREVAGDERVLVRSEE